MSLWTTSLGALLQAAGKVVECPNCPCGEFLCPVPTLDCESTADIYDRNMGCGEAGFVETAPFNFYRKSTITISGTHNDPETGCSASINISKVKQHNTDCSSSTTTCSGSNSSSGPFPCTYNQAANCADFYPFPLYQCACLPHSPEFPSWTVVSDSVRTRTYTYSDGGPDTETETLSELNTETLADFIQRALDELAAVETPTGIECTAYRNLSVDEESIALRRFNYKIVHFTPEGCYLKVWVDRVFTPESGTAVTTADPSPYEYIGIEPCDPLIEIESGWYSVVPPAEDGTISTRIRYSCLLGYEPDFNEPVNGYP